MLNIAQKVEKILTLAHSINKKLKGKIDLTMIQAQGDIKSQLDNLIHKGFVTEFGESKLDDIFRYVQAIEKRLEKLAIDPTKDRRNMISVEKVNDVYTKLVKGVAEGQAIPEELVQLRWMIEELRVSLFAQTLGTTYPISEKRIFNYIAEIKK